MSKAKVFITRSLPKIELEQLHQIAEIETWTERQPPPYSVLLNKVKEIDGLLCLLTDSIDRQLIETGKSLLIKLLVLLWTLPILNQFLWIAPSYN